MEVLFAAMTVLVFWMARLGAIIWQSAAEEACHGRASAHKEKEKRREENTLDLHSA